MGWQWLSVTCVVIFIGGRFVLGNKLDELILFVAVADSSLHDIGVFDFINGAIRNMSLTGLVEPFGVGYDPVKEKVYFTDRERKIIGRVRLNGSDYELLLQFDAMSKPEGLFVDSVSRLLYWVDEGHDSIFVSNLDGTKCWPVVEDELQLPRAVVVDPVRGYIYWSEWTNTDAGRIEKAFSSGENREVLVDSDIKWPNCLALDDTADMLYWCDAFYDRIERINVNGLSREVILVDIPIRHPFDIALAHSTIFWTERQIHPVAIVHADLVTMDVIERLNLGGNFGMSGLWFYNSSRNMGNNQCSRNNGGCYENQLCLPTPYGRKCQWPDKVVGCNHEPTTTPRVISTTMTTKVRYDFEISNCPEDKFVTISPTDESIAVIWIEPLAVFPNGTRFSAQTKSHSPGEDFPLGTRSVIYIFQNDRTRKICSFAVNVGRMTTTQPATTVDNTFIMPVIIVAVVVLGVVLLIAIVITPICLMSTSSSSPPPADTVQLPMDNIVNPIFEAAANSAAANPGAPGAIVAAAAAAVPPVANLPGRPLKLFIPKRRNRPRLEIARPRPERKRFNTIR